MKKKSWILIIVLLMAIFTRPISAEEQLDHVTDAANLLTAEEWQALENKAEQFSEQYECGIYIITVDDFTDYVNTSEIEWAAETFYTEYELGYGSNHDGILLLLSMDERDYVLVAYGYGNTAFTDYGKDLLAEKFLDDFKVNDWYEGLDDFIEESGAYLASSRSGNPIDVGSDPRINSMAPTLAILMAFVLSLIICLILKSRMKSVHKGTQASAYIPKNSIEFTQRQDIYTHTTTTRTKIEKNNSSRGGTSVNARGFSSKSGKF